MNIRNRGRDQRRRASAPAAAARAALESLERRTLLTAGGLDPTFGTGGIAYLTSQRPAEIRTVAGAHLPDGKLLLLGEVIYTDGYSDNTFALTRLNADGSPDATFGRGGTLVEPITHRRNRTAALPGTIPLPQALAVDDQGRIYVGGKDFNQTYVARLNPNGTADATFGVGGMTLDGPTPRGYAPTALDLIGAMDHVGAIQPTADGGILVAGAVHDRSRHLEFSVVRLDGNGGVDTAFGTNGASRLRFTRLGHGINASVRAMAVDASGRILLAGGGSGFLELARLDATGRLDPSFGTGGAVRVATDRTLAGTPPSYDPTNPNIGSCFSTLAVRASDGAIFAGGGAGRDSYATGPLVVAAFTDQGALDRHFGHRGVVQVAFASSGNQANAQANGIDLLDDGNLLVAGSLIGATATPGLLLAKLGPTGQPDLTFGTSLVAPAADAPPPGWRAVPLARPSNDSAGLAESAGIVSGGNGSGTVLLPVCGGIDNSPFILPTALRLNVADGSLDASFGRAGVATAQAPVVDAEHVQFIGAAADGHVVVERLHDVTDDVSSLTADGTAVSPTGLSWPSPGLANSFISTAKIVAVQPDGKLLAQDAPLSGPPGVDLLRYNADGSLDTSFGTAGRVTLPEGQSVSAVLQRPDGSMAVGATSASGPFHLTSDVLYDLTANGTITAQVEMPFGSYYGYYSSAVRGLALAPDGSVLVAADQLTTGPRSAVLAYSAGDLSPVTSFGVGGTAALPDGLDASSLAVLPDGRIRVQATQTSSTTSSLVVALTPTGAIDTSYGPNGDGTATIPADIPQTVTNGHMLAQADGKLLFVGRNNDTLAIQVFRLAADGTPDTTFGTNDLATIPTGPDPSYLDPQVTLQETSDGEKLLVAGSALRRSVFAHDRPTLAYVARVDL